MIQFRPEMASYSPFDAWIDGNETAISQSARRGFSLFNIESARARCHTDWNFTDNRFHDIGTTSTDIGRGALDAFKTPITARRTPNLHGSFATLNDVLAPYLKGGIDRPSTPS
jgi:cytochrome c peroxidase